MSNFKLRTPLFGLLVLFLALSGCGNKKDAAAEAQEGGKPDFKMGAPIQDSTYAVIVSTDADSDTLTTADFYRQLNYMRQQFPMMNASESQAREMRRSLVEQFAIRRAILDEIERLDLKADTARVNEQMGQILARFPNREAFQQALAAENITEDSLRSSISEMVRQQLLQERITDEAKAPSDEEVEAFRKERAEQIRAQHILFLSEAGANPAEDSTIRARAQMVLDSVKAGADFAELARRYSDDGSAAEGGDLNYFSRGQMVKPFEEAAFALKDSSDVTPELVRTRYGYHIIRLTDRRTGDLMDKTRAVQTMLDQRKQEVWEKSIDNLREQVTVRVNPKVVGEDVDVNEPLEDFDS